LRLAHVHTTDFGACRAMAASGARMMSSQMITSSSSATAAAAGGTACKPYGGRHRCAVNVRRGARQTTITSASAASANGASTPLRMIVLRHSDSCTEDASLKDHDRPLTVWGRTLAASLCENLVEAGWATPDLVLCSASVRSRETLDELTKVHPPVGAAETLFLGSLYHFAAMDGVTADHLRETIVQKSSQKSSTEKSTDQNSVRTVMCIGHNKGWEEAASDFAGTAVKLQVANAALLECDSADVTTWEQAFAGLAKKEKCGDTQLSEKAKEVGWRVVAVVQHGVEDEGFLGSGEVCLT
jgi:phosphohistidine phosphatase SixA